MAVHPTCQRVADLRLHTKIVWSSGWRPGWL
jgi:hypothetical protein